MLAYCHRTGKRVVCSAGAGSRADPTRLHITDIAHTVEDELARAVRKRLSTNYGITEGIPVVYSTERTNRRLLDFKEHQQDNPKDYQTMEKFRIRIIPVLGTMPTIMGNALAAYILCELAQQPIRPKETQEMKPKLYKALLKGIKDQTRIRRNEDLFRMLPFKTVCELYSNVYKSKSVLSGQVVNPALCPWLFEQPLHECDLDMLGHQHPPDVFSHKNLVLLTGSELKRHLERGGTPAKNILLYGEDGVRKIEESLACAKKIPLEHLIITDSDEFERMKAAVFRT